jgi:hypothetical protein
VVPGIQVIFSAWLSFPVPSVLVYLIRVALLRENRNTTRIKTHYEVFAKDSTKATASHVSYQLRSVITSLLQPLWKRSTLIFRKQRNVSRFSWLLSDAVIIDTIVYGCEWMTWLVDTFTGILKYFAKNLLRCRFSHDRTHMNCPGIKF